VRIGINPPRAPDREPGISAPAFVGRSWHLGALEQALARPPAVVLIEGEAGIGKTRLVQELLASPRMLAHRALVGVCPPFREPATLAPVVEALRPAGRPVGELALSRLGGALRPLFPEWAADLPPPPEPLGDAEATRHRLYRALAELIGCLGVTLLVVEDVHWADEVSLEFLLFLTTRQQTSRELSLIVTYRPEDVPEGSLLLRLSSRLPHGVTQTRLAPPPLGVADTAELVSSMLSGTQVSETFAAFLHERTDGVPLAVEESVRLLGDRADLVRRDGRWVRSSLAGLQVPPTVRDSTLERVRRQSPATQLILQAAAVAGPADEAILGEVADLPAVAVRTGAAHALAAGLLQEGAGGQLGFRHVLSATAVYEATDLAQRRRLHLRTGQALERSDPPPAVRLARHFRKGQDVARWAHWAERAAAGATASSDHLTALSLLVDLPGVAALPVPVRVRLAKQLALAALFQQVADEDQSGRVVRTLRGVLELPRLPVRQRAELRNLLGRLLNQLGEPAAAFAELAKAIPHLGHAPVEAARSMISLGWPRAGPWPAAVHLRWLRRADRLPTGSLTPADRLGLLADRAAALLQLGAEAGWEVAGQLPESVTGPEERLHLARGYLNIGDAAMHWGRYPEARRLLTAGLRLAEANEFGRIRQIIRATLTYLDWLTGAWEGLAERVAGLTAPDQALHGAEQEVLLVGALLAAAQGGYDRADEHLRAGLEEARRRGWVALELPPAAALARLRLAEGDVASARKLTDEPMHTVAYKRIWVWAADIAPVRVEVLRRAGEPAEAARLVAALARGLRGRDAPAPRAALLTCRAILAEPWAGAAEPAAAGAAGAAAVARAAAGVAAGFGQAAAGFARAAAAWDALPRPYDALLARERRARCLLLAGQRAAGLAGLGEAFDGFRALGAGGDADRVAGWLRDHGMRLARPGRRGRRGYGDQLSPREREVVRLVATGRTNREIARQLSKAPGTVAEQLRSAMRKLGVSSRTALAVRAIEAGIADQAAVGAGRDIADPEVMRRTR
jgi:DNA-binding CsgD family transcriptional regulator/tetratricopeptide (TPR) repeat protein